MSRRTIRRTQDPYEALERMLVQTTLVTQRVGHDHIIDIGDKILDTTRVDDQGEKEKIIEDAVEASEARATRELRAALKRLRQEKDIERQNALDKQKWYFERLAARVSDQRDGAEAERMRELRKELEDEKKEALRHQWEECERLKEVAVKEACAALRMGMQKEQTLEKDKAVADALRRAQEAFKKKELVIIEQTREMCEKAAQRETERVAALHRAEVNDWKHRYNTLQKKYDKELAHRKEVERDFRALQEDYKRFMDYTDGKFHSDYLMRLRYLGMQLAQKQISTVTYENVEPLNL